MIEIRGVSKFFDDKTAVDSIDLDIPRGSIFGLIGPNGAGKTTTLKIIATLIKPDEGTVVINDKCVIEKPELIRRQLGYMPDAFGAFPGLSCEEYLLFFGRCYGLGGSELNNRIQDVLTLTDLGGLRNELTPALSTGMRQRLCLAKTLLHDPDLLILDEPASGLDPRARIEIRVLLMELGKMGKTIVISSHILADLEEICTDIGIIEQGKVAWQGSLESAKQSEQTVVKLEVPEGDVERTKELLQSIEIVSSVKEVSDSLEAELITENSNAILEALLEAGVEVHAFSRKKVDLETLFLESTKGIVS